METIQVYLNNLFNPLPTTAELENLKTEIQLNMEEKYHELKAEGKSENEAVGIVISEFGNIDELLVELNVTLPEATLSADETFPIISLKEANSYILATKRSSKIISSGIALILFGVICLVGVTGLVELNVLKAFAHYETIMTIFLLFCIGCAVSLFIYSDSFIAPYKHIKHGKFSLYFETKAILEKDYPTTSNHATKFTIIGIVLCILAAVPVLISDLFGPTAQLLGVCVLLLMIVIAIFCFVTSNMPLEAYKQLFKEHNASPNERQNTKTINIVSGIIWPLATCIFFVGGFIYKRWDICWIVFPITGVLYGAFCNVYQSIKSED